MTSIKDRELRDAQGARQAGLSPRPIEERSMKGYVADIEALTEGNTDFRRVLYTGHHLQLVLMSLAPGQDIGSEVHATHDQFFRVETGRGEAVIDGIAHVIKAGSGIIVPAGARHNLRNTGEEALKVYTLYGPAHHLDRLVQRTKADALASDEAFAGATTE